MKINGKAWKYGNDVNTDVIFPGKYTYTVSEPKEMAKYALEDLDPEFASNVQGGDVVVGGENFGCGSSREQAPISIKEAGAGAIVAKSFARIFFRNAINAGLLVIVCPRAVDAVSKGDEMEIDTDSGCIMVKEQSFTFPPFTAEVQEILNAGGLVEYTKMKISGGKN
ncbi:3-isopropylmalate dehydratase [Candidatus Riflebacteria bacterium]